jgi:hypothetical protein
MATEKKAEKKMTEAEWLAYTAEVWGKQYGRELTIEEAREIDANVGRLCRVLIEVARDRLQKEKADKAKAITATKPTDIEKPAQRLADELKKPVDGDWSI